MRLIRATAMAAALVAGTAVAGTASAHHSFAMFDTGRTITITGAVQAYEWTNPHSEVVVVGGPAGQPAKAWALELTSPNNLLRMGWSKRSLKPGDKVSVVINPLRSGEPGGALLNATLTDTGQVLTTHHLADVAPKPGL
jgi:hypothetical protein